MFSNCALPGLLAVAAFQSAALAQSNFGEWEHPTTIPTSFYVSPTGDDVNNDGFTPDSPFQTIERALQEADNFLFISILASPNGDGSGATINIEPATYTLTQPIEVPAFGISIEPYWSDDPTAEVVIQGAPDSDIFRFTAPYGPLTLANLTAAQLGDLPASQLRGMRLVGDTTDDVFGSGDAVFINLSLGSREQFVASDVAVGVRECTIEEIFNGVVIIKDPEDSYVFRNEIVDNQISAYLDGVFVTGGTTHSDLIRSNEIFDCRVGIRAIGAGGEFGGTHRPRILSNTITNCGNHNFQAVGGSPLSAGVLLIGGVSGQIVGNTIAFTQHNCPNGNTCLPLPGNEPAGITYLPSGLDSGETLVIANNLLFNPPYTIFGATFDTFEINVISGSFPGTLIVESNDFEGMAPIVNVPAAASPTNTQILDPLFVGGLTAPFDVHLTAASLNVVGLGDPAFTEPGPASSFTIGGVAFPANCALDVDRDARVSRLPGAPAATIQRGGDQLPVDVSMEAPTAAAGVPATQLADAFGTVVPSANGNNEARIEVTAPVGSSFFTFLCATLPQGPEVQHFVFNPTGSLAIDPDPANALVIGQQIGTTAGVTAFNVNFGAVSQTFLEAEVYLQTWVIRPDGTDTFTNRIRLDLEQD